MPFLSMKETKGCCTCKGPTITFYGVNMYLIIKKYVRIPVKISIRSHLNFFIRNIMSPTHKNHLVSGSNSTQKIKQVRVALE